MSFDVVILSTGVFAGIILVLVTLVYVVKKNFGTQGDCKVIVNDESEPMIVAGGENLLSALSNNKVFLPSACGWSEQCNRIFGS